MRCSPPSWRMQAYAGWNRRGRALSPTRHFYRCCGRCSRITRTCCPLILRKMIIRKWKNMWLNRSSPREGANVSIIENGKTIEAAEGPYGEEGMIVQQFHPLPKFGDSYMLIGSWLVNDQPAGIGIREDRALITRGYVSVLSTYFLLNKLTIPDGTRHPVIVSLSAPTAYSGCPFLYPQPEW